MDDGLYIGLISGTSVDGVDAALVSFAQGAPALLCSHLHPFPDALRQDIQNLFRPSNNEIDRLGECDIAVGEIFAEAVESLLGKAGRNAGQIRAIGCHGQTIRHRPLAKRPFTLQIGNPYVIAARTGIDVVWDFRRRDMAQGGQGAPLAPLFHQAFLASPDESRVVLNLGGIANVTLLPADGRMPVAFDTGPANGLMDAWIQLQRQQSFDAGGQWAATAAADSKLLQQFLAEPYFQLPAPKSTGKELFHLPWAQQIANLEHYAADVIQATFLALSTESIATAIEMLGGCERVLACGGGVHNHTLVTALQQRLGIPVESTAKAGIEPDWVEAMAFAWLAQCHLNNQALVTGPFTGATAPVLLGSLVPGG